MSLKNSIKAFKSHLGDKESVLDSNYPRIAEMLELHWGYKEFYLYINKLLIVEKNKARVGFPIEALEEIYLLQEIHNRIFPKMKNQAINDMNNNPYIDKKQNSILL